VPWNSQHQLNKSTATCDATTGECQTAAIITWKVGAPTAPHNTYACSSAALTTIKSGFAGVCASKGFGIRTEPTWLNSGGFPVHLVRCVDSKGNPATEGMNSFYLTSESFFTCPKDYDFQYKFPGNSQSASTGICTKQATCVKTLTPMDTLKQLHDTTTKQKTCTDRLEAGGNCNDLNDDGLAERKACLTRAFAQHNIVIPAQTNSEFRSPAYQKHLVEIYDYEREYKQLKSNEKKECDIVNAWHKPKNHGRLHSPSTTISQHNFGKAFDIDVSLIRSYVRATGGAESPAEQLTGGTGPVGRPLFMTRAQPLVRQASACSLRWGGTFIRIDDPHFDFP
jgi:D-alanyl-D-alanine carboxypeptidase